MTEWNRTQFNDELQALLNIRPPISMSKIKPIRDLAISHPESQNYIVQTICKFIETSPPDYRMAGLFLIDSVIRHCKDKKEEDRIAGEYRKRFAIVLKEGLLTGLFSPCNADDKTRIGKLLNYWSENVYSCHFVDPLRITLVQDMTTTRPRQPVVLPSSYATEMCLQQQGWQPTTMATYMSQGPNQDLRTSISPQPMGSMNDPSQHPQLQQFTSPPPSQQQQQAILTPVSLPMADFSNAVMHFISALNYRPPPVNSMLEQQMASVSADNSVSIYSTPFPPMPMQQQTQDYSYFPRNETTNTENTETNVHNDIKQESLVPTKDYRIPTCQLAEQTANDISESTTLMGNQEERDNGTFSTIGNSNMSTTAISDTLNDKTGSPQLYVKRELPNDTPFDQPIVTSAHSVSLSTQQQQQLITEDTSELNGNTFHIPPPSTQIEPPRTPPRQQSIAAPWTLPGQNVKAPLAPTGENNGEKITQNAIPPPSCTPPRQNNEPSSNFPSVPEMDIKTEQMEIEPSCTPPRQNVVVVKPPSTPPRNSMSTRQPSTPPPPSQKNSEQKSSNPAPQKAIKPPRTPPHQNKDHLSRNSPPRKTIQRQSNTPPMESRQVPRSRTPPRSRSTSRKGSISNNSSSSSQPRNDAFVTNNPSASNAMKNLSQEHKILKDMETPTITPNVQKDATHIKEPIKSIDSNDIKPPKTPPLPPKQGVYHDTLEPTKKEQIVISSISSTATKYVAPPKTPPRRSSLRMDQGNELLDGLVECKTEPSTIIAVAPPKTPPRIPQKRLREPPPLTLDKSMMESSCRKKAMTESAKGDMSSPSRQSFQIFPILTSSLDIRTRKRSSRWGVRGDDKKKITGAHVNN